MTTSILSEQQKLKEYVPPDRIEKSLNKIKNENLSDSQKYESFAEAAFYIQDAYYRTNNPEIRKYLDSLNNEVKKLFPKDHQKEDFKVVCADSQCGETIDKDLTNLIQEIKNLDVDNAYKKTILTNLNNAAYIPYDTQDNKLSKLVTYGLVRAQLIDLSDAQASSSAKKLELYIINKHNVDLGELNTIDKIGDAIKDL